MKDCIIWVENKGWDLIIGLMDRSTKVNGTTIKSLGTVFIHGEMGELMRGNGKIII